MVELFLALQTSMIFLIEIDFLHTIQVEIYEHGGKKNLSTRGSYSLLEQMCMVKKIVEAQTPDNGAT